MAAARIRVARLKGVRRRSTRVLVKPIARRSRINPNGSRYRTLTMSLSATGKASGWLEERIATLKDEVRQAEEAVAQFRAKNNLFDTQGRRIAYRPARGTKSLFTVQGAWCGTVDGLRDGGLVLAVTADCARQFMR